MAHTTPGVLRLSALATCVASAVSFSALANNWTEQPVEVLKQYSASDKLTNKNIPLLSQHFPTYYIVQLESPSLAMAASELPGALNHQIANGNRLNLSARSAQNYSAQLQREQQSFAFALESRFSDVQIQRSLHVTMNGLIVAFNGNVDYRARLASMPGVKAVYEHKMYYASMDASLELINQPEVAAMLGGEHRAGEGVKVAIIDSGIRPENPMFAANGHVRPSDLPNDDYCSMVDASFCNDKLALARYYAPTFPDVHPDEYMSPLDLGGHGTHVSGTAVGNSVVADYNDINVAISGVAPGATLMVYKALFRTPTSSGGSNVMLVSALEDAIADGADIINNSWGGGPGENPANSPYTAIFEAAEQAGVVMVSAAGNDGFAGIGCPACAEPGITVANTQHGRVFGHAVNVGNVDTIIGMPGDGDFTINTAITGPLMPVMEIDQNNEFACTPFQSGSLDGVIALVSRGNCAFSEKADNVQAGGAAGLIVFNNEPGRINMSMPGVTLPSVSITQAEGGLVLDALSAQGNLNATIGVLEPLINENSIDVISSTSSRGPGGDSSFLKPDVAAPGSDILSAYSPDTQADFHAISGTSMASPHVAGAAALLLQQNPDLDAYQIKSILMSSTTSTVLADDGITPATPFDRGAGRIDLAAAANTVIWFDGPSLNSNACNITCSFERTVYNLLDVETHWRGTVTFWDQDVSAELSETEITLGADNGVANFKLDIDVLSAEPGWKFGEIVWTSLSGNYAPARMPVVINAGLSDNSQVNQTSFISPFEFGAPVQLRSRAGATGVADPFLSFLVEIPDGVELDVNSITISTDAATETDFSIAEDQRSFSWEGEVNYSPIVASVESASASAFPYAGLSLVDVGLDSNDVDCASACDEIVTTLNVASFGLIHNGQPIQTLHFSENGLTAANSGFVGSYVIHELPGQAIPNNVIAPLWADFVFGPNVGGGRVIYNVISDAVDTWLVIEWHNVRTFDSPHYFYTFSQWMKVNSDEIYFNYIDIPNQLNASIGIENADGTVGASYYYNGSGTFPANDSALSASIKPGQAGFVQIDYEITADHFGQSRGVELETLWGSDIDINLGALFSTRVDDHYVYSAVQSNNVTYESFLPVDLSARGAVTVDIVSPPENGSLTLSGNASPYEYVYTPDSGFVGEDSFIYQAVDIDRNTTAQATVTIDVVNAPPTASASAPARADGGDVVTLDARGSSDPDGDQLNYSWVQTSGPQVTLSSTSASAVTFEAPNQNATVSFTVTVSDGNLSDTASVSVTITAVEPPPVEPPPVEPPVEEENRSKRKWYKGSFGASLALVGLPLVWLRRRAIKVHD